jgi:hypothetical protein
MYKINPVANNEKGGALEYNLATGILISICNLLDCSTFMYCIHKRNVYISFTKIGFKPTFGNL